VAELPDGRPPRVPPLAPEEWDDSLRALFEATPGALGRPLNIFATLARAPQLFWRWLGFAGALLDGRLSPRLREIAILRTARLCGSEYEWVQHVPIAERAGLSGDEIAALRGPIDPSRWTEQEAVVLRASDELHDRGDLADETWALLRRHFDDASSIELVMLVGHYQLLATTLRTLRIHLES
jgi:4-carboxymuconolactone decarboxylase